MIDARLLSMLVCPEHKTPLTVAAPELVRELNASITQKKLLNRAGERIKDKLEGALVRADGRACYAIHDGMPCLLLNEQIALQQLASFQTALQASARNAPAR